MSAKIPNFFIVGAPKCGTTAMYEYLAQHPEIFMSPRKELHFFGKDLQSASFTKDLQTYLSYFKNSNGHKITGEASVWYLYSHLAAQEIKELSPGAKILIMLRSPVDMVYSNYYQMLYNGNESVKPFSKALALESKRKNGTNIPSSTHFINSLYYTETAKYYNQVRRYLEIFGKEQVKIIFYEDFKTNTQEVYKSVLKFLDVNPDFKISYKVVNANKVIKNDLLNKALLNKNAAGKIIHFLAKGSIPSPVGSWIKKTILKRNMISAERPQLEYNTYKYLINFFDEDIDQLSQLVDRDLSNWKKYKFQ